VSIKWTRAPAIGRSYTCGLCGHVLAANEPMKLLSVDRVAAVLVRCECDGPAPPDLPALPERSEPTAPAFKPLRQLLPLEYAPTRPKGRDE
jgi:hypothetical protein